MALTEFSSTDAQAVKLFSKMTFREAIRGALINKLMGTDKQSVLTRLTDLEKNAGDQIKYDLLVQTSGSGVTGNNWMEDNEAPMTYYQDDIDIDQLRQAHTFDSMSQQRTIHDMRKDAMENLKDWWANTLDNYMFRSLCGDTTFSHAGNTGVAADTDHYIVCGDVAHSDTIATDEASLGNNDQIDLMDLDYAKEKSRTITPMIRPTKIEGEEYYVAVLHDYSLTDLRVSTNSSATVKWTDIQQYANVRGLKNPIFSGANGVYNKVVIYDSNRIYSPRANVRRNLFLGAQAGTLAIGNAYAKMDQGKFGDLPMSWAENIRDYNDKKGIAAGMVFGIKATRYNSKNYGCLVMTAYSTSHG
ncbi:MAG: N4-gp56 family major capsid protein [Bacillota bacterium]|nr:N4-gp56 family major capsid protein [Bacillota bacterium]